MTSSISRVVRAIRWAWPTGRGGAPGRVTSIRSATSRRSSSLASSRPALRLQQRLQLLASLVGGAADLAPFLCRQFGDTAQDRRQLRFAPEVADPQLLQLGARRRRPRSPRAASPLISSIRSSIGLGLRHGGRRYPLAADRRRGGDVERLGAAGRSGIVTSTSHSASTSAGQPSRSAPQAERRRARQRVEPLAAVGDQRGPRRRRLPHLAPRRRLGEDRAHARPHRLRREGVGAAGAEHDRAVEQGVGGADDGADVAGVGDAVQVDAGRPGRLGTSAAARPRSPASPSRARRRRRAAPARPPRRPARCRRRSAGSAARRRRPARPRPGPRPRSRTAPRARDACGRAACGPASASRCGGWRSSCCRSWSAVSSPGTKKAGRLHGPPGKVECRRAARRPHPPGLAPQIGGRHRGR